MVEIDEDTQLRKKMTALARTFPAMRNAPGIDPWQPNHLKTWADGPASHGERLIARFLLGVWDNELGWLTDPFDVMEALRVWDLTHREAFLRWAADPWWG